MHNLFFSLLQQIGIFGLLFLIFVFKFFFEISSKLFSYILLVFYFLVGSLFGDISYFALFWLIPCCIYIVERFNNATD